MRGKNGGELLESTIIFILLNLLFFIAMFAFVARVGSGAGLQEQESAKQIALLIDSSLPKTIISLNINEVDEFAKKQGISLNDAIKIHDDKVVVKLTKESQGYSFPIFSNYNIKKAIKEENENMFLVLNIEEK